MITRDGDQTRSLTGADGSDGGTRSQPVPPARAAAASPPALGECLGRYTLRAHLGAGGMGEVYAAHDPELDRVVAVKVVRTWDGDATPTAMARFQREALAMARLNHPNVVSVFDAGRVGDRVFVAMELVEGPTLASWLAERPRSWREVVSVFLQAGRGLAAAHAAGIVHRDFKPSNVILGDRVRVADFGLAKPAAELDARSSSVAGVALDVAITRTGAAVGTPAYMAPEQRAGGAVTEKADQYSFCVALREALASGPRGRSRDDQRALRVPRFLRTLVARGLASDPGGRFTSMATLLAALERGVRPVMWLAPRKLALAGVVVFGAAATIAYLAPFERAGAKPSAPDAIAGRAQAWPVTPDRALRSGLRPVKPEAYEALMRARYLSVSTTDADSQHAIELLEGAVKLEPDFAQAYAELAAARVMRLSFVSPNEARELGAKAFAAAGKAESLDPELPELYLARGDLLWTDSQRFAHDRAAKEFRRALSLNPSSDQAHARLARVYVHVGLFVQAMQHVVMALDINPSNAQALNTRAEALLWLGNERAALETYRVIPDPVLPELVEANMIFALLRLNERARAKDRLELARSRYANDASGNLAGIAALLVADSDPREAERLIALVDQRKAVNPAHHAAYFAACACARIGRAREAVDWLRKAAETGFPCHALFARDPNLDPIRDDPGFKAFMAELLSQAWPQRVLPAEGW